MVMLDVETSGLDPQRHQILTLDATYLTRVGVEWVPTGDSLSTMVSICPWARIEDQALKVNRLKLEDLNRMGRPEADVMAALVAWVKNCAATPQGEGAYILLAGYNVGFDRSFLEAAFDRAHIRWTEAFSYRHLDVKELVQWARIAGMVKGDRLRLEGVARQLGCHQDGAHASDVDVAMTIAVMNTLLARIAQGTLF